MIEIERIDVTVPDHLTVQFIESWFNEICTIHNRKLGDVTLIFCNDDYLLSINNQYLNHNYYTDIITFNYNESNVVNGDLFISIDRVLDNAPQFNSTIENELHRVCCHGLLHLCGFNDKTPKEEGLMRELEQACLDRVLFHVKH